MQGCQFITLMLPPANKVNYLFAVHHTKVLPFVNYMVFGYYQSITDFFYLYGQKGSKTMLIYFFIKILVSKHIISNEPAISMR